MENAKTVYAIPTLVLGSVLFTTYAWADPPSRPGTSSIQGPQPPTLCDKPLYGTELIPGGLLRGTRTIEKLDLKSLKWGPNGSLTTSSQLYVNTLMPGQLPEYDIGGTGIPLWRW
jgi:hypothetical protein